MSYSQPQRQQQQHVCLCTDCTCTFDVNCGCMNDLGCTCDKHDPAEPCRRKMSIDDIEKKIIKDGIDPIPDDGIKFPSPPKTGNRDVIGDPFLPGSEL